MREGRAIPDDHPPPERKGPENLSSEQIYANWMSEYQRDKLERLRLAREHQAHNSMKNFYQLYPGERDAYWRERGLPVPERER